MTPGDENSPEEEPTQALPADPEPETARLGREQTGETEVRPGRGESPPPGSAGSGNRRRGLITLAVSILLSLLLAGGYLAAGGLDYKPSGGTDPCDARPWTKGASLEDTAQDFTLSVADGAACELGVSREDLIRAIADEGSLQQFADANGFSDEQIQSGLRAGLNRAIDDAEAAGVVSSAAATGLRGAVSIAPTSLMLGLIDNAGEIFKNGGLNNIIDAINGIGGAGGIGGILDAITGAASGSSSGQDKGETGKKGSGGSGASADGSGASSGLCGVIESLLPRDVKKQIDKNLPKGTSRKDLENQAYDALQDLFGQ